LAFEGDDREALRARPWHTAQQMHRDGGHDLFFDREPSPTVFLMGAATI
jgi:hypothetical protein